MNRRKIDVYYNNQKVGILALNNEGRTVFEYSDSWFNNGFSISPLSLPLRKTVFECRNMSFDGLFGVFDDSLPDGWGRLLTDRMLRKNGIDPSGINCLDRLAIVGSSGMGALSYLPADNAIKEDPSVSTDYDRISEKCARILSDQEVEDFDELYRLGSSSGGARPKILCNIGGESWIVKFPSHYDHRDIGKEEYDYSVCARKCGIEVSETKLIASERCSGYFATKRFDRMALDGVSKRIHMVSASGLLETSHRLPNLDYEILMKLTLKLTESMYECEKLYRLMCFNVFAHNRDDHSRNFSYLYDDEKKSWRLSPAYDLTYSSSLNGEHATTVHGNGSDPKMSDILSVADYIGMDRRKAEIMTEEIRNTVDQMLGKYLKR